MKKNRNSFFSEANMNYANYNPNMMAANQPFQSATAYNSFYAGPNPNYGANMNMNPMYDGSDLESRLAKMERQINRLEHRISKLETSNTYITEDYDNTTNNMYML